MCMSIMQIQKFLPHKMLITCQCGSIQNYAVALWLMQAGTNDSSPPTHRVHVLLVLSASSFIWKLIFSEEMEDWSRKENNFLFPFLMKLQWQIQEGQFGFSFSGEKQHQKSECQFVYSFIGKKWHQKSEFQHQILLEKATRMPFFISFSGKTINFRNQNANSKWMWVGGVEWEWSITLLPTWPTKLTERGRRRVYYCQDYSDRTVTYTLPRHIHPTLPLIIINWAWSEHWLDMNSLLARKKKTNWSWNSDFWCQNQLTAILISGIGMEIQQKKNRKQFSFLA